MSKRRAILIVVGVMAVIYLFLLVGLPALSAMVPPCGSCNESSSETINYTASNITEDWLPAVPLFDDGLFDDGPYERNTAPLIIYLTPGLVGVAFIIAILKQKNENKEEENDKRETGR